MHSRAPRYGIAIAMAIAAALIQNLFSGFFAGIPFFLFFVTIFVSAFVAGIGPGILATLLSAALTVLLVRPIDSGIAAAQTGMFVVTGLALSWFVSARREHERLAHRAEHDAMVDLANVAPAITWVTAPNGQCTFVNDRWLEFSGRTREQETGFGWMDIIHPDDRTTAIPEFDRAFEAREPIEIEYRMLRHDGVWRRVLGRAVPRFSREGNFTGYVGVALDIEDLRAAEDTQVRLSSDIKRERERLLAIVSNVPGVVWEAWGQPDTASQQIDFVSDHVTRMLGYSVEEWLATPNFWLTIVHPDDREAAAAHAREHWTKGTSTEANRFRWITKDGRSIWCEAQSTIIHDANGNPIGMRGVTVDISARKRAEDSLRFLARASEALSASLDYEATLKATPQLAVPDLADWCILGTVDGATPRRVAVVHRDPVKNEIAQRLLSIPPQKHLPQEIVDTFMKMEPFVMELDEATIANITTNDEHASIIRALGTACILVVPIYARDRLVATISFASATPHRYGEAEIDVAMLFARRVAVAVDNADLYRAAVNASTAKDEFLATVSHELRTPMTATLGWVRLLTLGQLDAETQKVALAAIEHATSSQAKLIDDILDVSSIILGKFHLDRGPVDLRNVVDAAAIAIRPALTAKAMSIDVDASRWKGVVQGDANRLRQVVWNLLSNAVKFGRRDGRISVVVERNESGARIEVRDDGAGIDPAFLPFVFDRFRQAESGSSRSHGGLGLGLAIVRHLVELHGGSVRATSDGRGHGATFVVELPAPEESLETVLSVMKPLPDLANKRIVVVDDEQATLDFIAETLRQCGARVTTARSADEAMLALNQGQHDLLLTDISMPGTDGSAMLHSLRERHKKIPAIALTARMDPVQGDFARVIRKPVDPLDLARQVKEVIG